ncbi:MAG TPA: phosphoribosylaminoimidazolesuccinocarboxamide synthase [Gemmatimonas sp.]|nr:phosphoribosylaminoimidazolesuccinocarboxamide synthase [Gemmatimonas sp.]
MSSAVAGTALPLPLARRGKVRDVYEVDADRLLLVTTDRISAFDVVMDEPIPFKGMVLTQLTAWWLGQLDGIIDHHLISADTDEIIAAVPVLREHRSVIAGRAMLCVRADVVPIECVIRGYITGSAWKEYRESGTLAGERLADGLRESDKLTPAIFSPATKAETGHDENITMASVVESVGADTAATLEALARRVYEFGRAATESRGIIVADTKFEFGWRDGRLLLIDEVLTPDSSRFWSAEDYAPGRSQPSFDKQPLRDWLDGERRAGRWNGDAPPPTLPADVIEATSLRYRDAFHRITGAPLDVAQLTAGEHA